MVKADGFFQFVSVNRGGILHMNKRDKLVRVIGVSLIALVIAITIWGCVSGHYSIAILIMLVINAVLPSIVNKIKGN